MVRISFTGDRSRGSGLAGEPASSLGNEGWIPGYPPFGDARGSACKAT